MNKEKIYTEGAPHISIDCQGDLTVRAWTDTQISAKGDDFELNESESGWSVVSRDSLSLHVPEGSRLSIVRAGGDLAIKRVTGDISIEEAGSDVVLSGVGAVTLKVIHHDMSASHINGRLHAETIHGDAVLRNTESVHLDDVRGDVAARYVNGDFYLGNAQGDVSLRTVNGDVTIQRSQRDANLRNLGGQTVVENIQGDIRLFGGLSASEHRLQAERDIIIRWPVSAPLNLTANAHEIQNKLPLTAVVEKEGMLVGRIGDGDTNLTASANGRIILKPGQVIEKEWDFSFEDETPDFDFAVDLEGLGAQIKSQLFDQVARITTDLEGKFGPEFTERISDKIARKAEQAAAKAERAAARAAERAERAAERARRRAEVQMRRSPGRPIAPKPPEPPKVTSEEQLKILRMVEKGIISPDEASTLLDALGR